MTISTAPRLWLLDDNIMGTGGHFLELASLLAGGAKDLGYAPRLAVHETLVFGRRWNVQREAEFTGCTDRQFANRACLASTTRSFYQAQIQTAKYAQGLVRRFPAGCSAETNAFRGSHCRQHR